MCINPEGRAILQGDTIVVFEHRGFHPECWKHHEEEAGARPPARAARSDGPALRRWMKYERTARFPDGNIITVAISEEYESGSGPDDPSRAAILSGRVGFIIATERKQSHEANVPGA